MPKECFSVSHETIDKLDFILSNHKARNQWSNISGTTAERGPGPPHSWGVLITHKDTPPLDEGSAPRKDVYLTTHKNQTSVPPAEFETAILASDRPYALTLNRSATEIASVSNT
jgi:hypothetical protein